MRADLRLGASIGIPAPARIDRRTGGFRAGDTRGGPLGCRRRRENSGPGFDLSSRAFRPPSLCRSSPSAPGGRPCPARARAGALRGLGGAEMRRSEPGRSEFLSRGRLAPGGMGMGAERALDRLSTPSDQPFPLGLGPFSPCVPAVCAIHRPLAAPGPSTGGCPLGSLRMGGRGGTGRRARFRFW